MSSNAGTGRGGGYGLDRELAERQALKYDPAKEQAAQKWIEDILNIQFSESFVETLKDGVVLCNLLNAIKPGTVKAPSLSKQAYFKMENISNFLKGCRSLGVKDTDCFETVDLYDEKDIGLVVLCIHALGGAVQKNIPSFSGPMLGVKGSQENKRQFSEKQLREAKAMPTRMALGSSETRGAQVLNERVVVDLTPVGHEVPRLNMGSSTVMKARDVDCSRDITFGAKFTGNSVSHEPTRVALGSSTVVKPNTQKFHHNDIDFGAKCGGDMLASEPSRISMGDSEIMKNREPQRHFSNDIDFGAKCGGSK